MTIIIFALTDGPTRNYTIMMILPKKKKYRFRAKLSFILVGTLQQG